MTADYNVGLAPPSLTLDRPQPAQMADQERAGCGRSRVREGGASPTL